MCQCHFSCMVHQHELHFFLINIGTYLFKNFAPFYYNYLFYFDSFVIHILIYDFFFKNYIKNNCFIFFGAKKKKLLSIVFIEIQDILNVIWFVMCSNLYVDIDLLWNPFKMNWKKINNALFNSKFHLNIYIFVPFCFIILFFIHLKILNCVIKLIIFTIFWDIYSILILFVIYNLKSLNY